MDTPFLDWLLWGTFTLYSPTKRQYMMTSSNGNIFRVTGPLCGEFTGPGEFPTQRPVTRNFGVFFDLRLNKRLSKQPWGWWFETSSWSLWRQSNGLETEIPPLDFYEDRRRRSPTTVFNLSNPRLNHISLLGRVPTTAIVFMQYDINMHLYTLSIGV